MSGFDLIIFDCDGVLVDSEIIAAEVDAELLSDAGYEIDAATVVERFAGMAWKDILLTVEREAALPLPATLLEQSEKILDERLGREVEPVPGVRFALGRIDLPRCICSNSSPQRLKLMLERTGHYDVFSPNIFSARTIGEGRPKPAPDVFLHAAKKFDADPSKVVVVEDSVHGIAGARSAGMRVVGFTGASHSYPSHADQLTEAGAETVINRMADLPAVVEALGNWSETI